MKSDRYRFDGTTQLNLDKIPTNSKKDKVKKEDILEKTQQNQEKIALLQERLYADHKEGVILVLQAIDAAGKDSTVKHVMSGVNPQGVDVVSFKAPNSEELAHDFLWRISKHLPERGKIGIFNRSHYEDVLVVQVHKMNRNYHMADRIVKMEDGEFFQKRYRHIRNFEEYLYDNSYRVVKIFLNVSKEEQKKRFLERIESPEKHWKFDAGDLKERALWEEYHNVFEDVINSTATPECPWYVLPADQKWYTRYLVSEILLKTLEEIDPQYPVVPEDSQDMFDECKRLLEEE